MARKHAALMEMSRLSKMISVIGSQKARIERLVQIAAIQCIGQSVVHRNVTPAINLYDVLGKSLRRASLLQYFETYGNIAYDKTARKIVFKDNGRKFDDETVALISKVSWFEAKKEEEPVSIFDVDAAFEKFFAALKKKVSDPGLTVEHADLYDVLHQSYLRWVVANGPTADTEPAQPGRNEVDAEKLAELVEHFGTPQVKAA